MTFDAATAPAHPAPARASEAAPALVLRSLVPLRFLAAAAQCVALAVAAFVLALPLPYRALAVVPALTALTNLPLWLGRVPSERARAVAAAVLLLDTLLFTALLHLSGGPDNPFSAIYAIHVAMAAMLGRARITWAVAALSAAGYALAFFWHEPQHFWHGPLVAGSSLQMHAVGMWVAVAVVAVVITYFIGSITNTLRATGQLAARNARLASLTTLAAGAAHELGSPLGTIAVIARDVARLAERSPGLEGLGGDAELLRSEVERCRRILDRMSALGGRAEGEADELRAEDVVAVLGPEEFGEGASRIDVRVDAPAKASLGAREDFAAVVAPLVRNALDASPSGARVRVDVALQGDRLRVRVRDEGHGMSAQVLEHASEPFFTTRPPGRGTGLGLFVVRLHTERLGGTFRLESAPGSGTTASAEWPLADELP